MPEEKINELVKNFPASGKKLLQHLIDEFAEKGIIFTNESQFQFELGFALQKLFDGHGKDYKVNFEVLSMNQNDLSSNNIEKLYTDLVVEMPNDKCAAIELKYKTALPSHVKLFKYTVNKKRYVVFAQGAYDNGCYDYWWDVHRLEQLVHKEIIYNFSDKKVIRGFAVIMSNDKNYWEEHNEGYFKNFMLTNTGEDSINGTRLWRLDGKDVQKIPGKKDKRYLKPIPVNGKYKIKWLPYLLENSRCELMPKREYKQKNRTPKSTDYNFKYLILDINNEK